MAHVAPIYPNFARGEVSPLMFGRIDIEQYPSCLDKCRNTYIRPYGCATRLTGTEFIINTKSGQRARLLKFVFSASDSYIIECGAGYFRFYQNGAVVLKSEADAWETAHNYAVGDFVTENDLMYYCVAAHTSATFADDLAAGKWVQQNIYELPNDYHEEQLDSIQYVQLDDIIKLTCLPYNNDNTTARPKELIRNASDDWTFQDVEFKEVPYLDANTTDITMKASAVTGDSITLTASEDYFNEAMIGTNFWIGTKVTDEDANKDIQGYVKITAYTDAQHVTAKVESKLSGTTATKLWGEGAFSDYRGYPAVVALFDGRLYYARTPHQPRNVYGSKPYAYETFTPAVDNEDDAGINIELATNANGDGSDIKWMIGASYLLCGTYGGEFVIRGTGDGAITPTDISARQRTNWGGEPIQPIVAGTFIHFLQRNGNKLRQFQYDYYYDAYKAVDVSIFSEHLLESPIKQMALQKNPDSIIYLMREDGKVVMLTLEQDQSVQAWSLLEDFDGVVEGIQTIPSFDGNYDEVYLLMNREAMATTLEVESSNPDLVITNNYDDAEDEVGVIEKTLTRSGSNVTEGNYNLYIRCGYLYSQGNLIDNECGWTAAGSYGIKNGKLYKISTNYSTVTLIDDSYEWTYLKGLMGIRNGILCVISNDTIYPYSDESLDGKWTLISNNGQTTYAINDGKLYSITFEMPTITVTRVGSLSTWTKLSGYYSEVFGTTYAYGIAGGRLYYLHGNSATVIGASSNWTDISGSSHYGLTSRWLGRGLGINNNKLYTLTTSATALDSSNTYKSISSNGSRGYALRDNGDLIDIVLSNTVSFKVLNPKDQNWETIIGSTYDDGCFVKKNGKLYMAAPDSVVEIGNAVPYWQENGQDVLLSDYKIVVTGTPNYYDTLTLTYTTIATGHQRYIERMLNPITSDNPEDWWYVRSGLKYNAFEQTEGITATLSDAEGDITITTDSAYFTEGMVGNKIKLIDSNYNTLGEADITAFTSSTEISASVITKFEKTSLSGGLWGVSIDTVSGISHLNGKDVQVFADGKEQAMKNVQQGTIQIDDAYIVVVGLPYTSYITTMPMEAGSQNGTAVGKRKRISEMAIRVWNSLGVKVGRDLDNLYDTIYEQEKPFTGVIPNIKYNQGWVWDANITVEQSHPYPMNILSIAPIVTEVDK